MVTMTGVNPTVSRVVTSSAAAVNLLAVGFRHSFSVFNEAAVVLFVKFGASASSTDYTVQIPAGGYYECPTSMAYQGIVTARLASGADSAAQVTSLA